jgi:hypothetical protein
MISLRGVPRQLLPGLCFYLGSHMPNWLWDPSCTFRLFIAHQRLARYKTLRRSTSPWALDSGGFSELSKHGRWTVTPQEYVRAVARYDREIGHLEWAAPQDWMCEPDVRWGGRTAEGQVLPGTHLSVAEHQARTVDNYCQLVELWPQESDDSCPIVPVLQGWLLAEYEACMVRYAAAGVDLHAAPVVGLGSICRRQNSPSITWLVSHLSETGLPLHGFGVKTDGLTAYGRHLASADSTAWSVDARHAENPLAHGHKTCANCLEYASGWRADLLAQLA